MPSRRLGISAGKHQNRISLGLTYEVPMHSARHARNSVQFMGLRQLERLGAHQTLKHSTNLSAVKIA
jgi:hypothetical protein